MGGLIILFAGLLWIGLGVLIWRGFFTKINHTGIRWASLPMFFALWLVAPWIDELVGVQQFKAHCRDIPELQFFGAIDIGPGYFYNDDGTPKWQSKREFGAKFSSSVEWKALFAHEVEKLHPIGAAFPIKHEIDRIVFKPSRREVVVSHVYNAHGGFIRRSLYPLFGDMACHSPGNWPDSSEYIKFSSPQIQPSK